MLRLAALCAITTLVPSCATPPPAAPVPCPSTAPSPEAQAPPPAAPDLTRWRQIKAAGGAVPPGSTAEGELPALVELLGSVDPEARDGLGYEIVLLWVGSDELLDADGVRALAALLRPRLRSGIDAGESDATFGRSFAALALSVIASRDVGRPTLTDPELFELLDDISWYAANETDLRGHTGATGWLHAAAHTADVLKFLARNPRITGDRAGQILDAVGQLVTRRHGYVLHHGEDARLAAPILELLTRDAIDVARFKSWVATIIEPLLQQSTGFDRVLYAAQRNARNLLFTLVASFELRTERSKTMDAARDALLGMLRAG